MRQPLREALCGARRCGTHKSHTQHTHTHHNTHTQQMNAQFCIVEVQIIATVCRHFGFGLKNILNHSPCQLHTHHQPQRLVFAHLQSDQFKPLVQVSRWLSLSHNPAALAKLWLCFLTCSRPLKQHAEREVQRVHDMHPGVL